jgi:protoheme IX farnesyltransferase
MSPLRDAIALTKPGITRMNVLMALGGFALAGRGFPPGLVAAATVGTGLAVSAANTLNQYLERDVDGLMARTAGRPLPNGRLDPRFALAFGIALGALSLSVLALAVNPPSALLALFAMVGYVGVYTPLKRRTPLALLIGAIPGAVPPLIGWTAATGTVDLPGLALFAILLVWQLPHFLAISLYRKDDYARAGILTVPVVRGDAVAKAQAIAWSVALLPISLSLVPLGVAGWIYGAAAVLLGAWFVGWSLRGLRADAGVAWARGFFLFSVLYLPALTLALAADVVMNR